jgi:hypothetical protein
VSVIIYGVRDYGRVDAHAGEHAQTKFFHIWFAPIVPVGSWWVTPTGGHSIKPSLKSIAAAYLRIWGVIATIGLLSAGLQQLGAKSLAGTGMLIAAACIGALTAWSWTWRNLRGAAAHRRSDFNYVAFGTRCEPSRRFAADRSELKRALDRRWNERAPSQSPNEVAAHGAADAGEAVLAYGLLRLSSIDRGRAGASDGADADRILDGKHTAPSIDDGPYRAGVTSPTDAKTADGLADLVTARAAATTPTPLPPTKVDREWELRRAKRRSRLQALGLVFMTFTAVGGVGMFAMSLRPTIEVSIKELRSAKPPLTRVVTLTCDAIEEPFWEEYKQRDNSTISQMAMCQVGRYFVPVKFPGSTVPTGRVVTGKLYNVERQDWHRELARVMPEVEAQTTDVFIDATKDSEEWGVGAFGLAMVLATPILWVLWFRARRRRKATERALAAE